MTGKISRMILDKGFEFITGDDGQDYFMQRSALSGDVELEMLREGRR
jgi:cold shock CspA family protein